MAAFKCVLFDIDNTLLYKRPAIWDKVYEAAAPMLPGLTLEDVERAYAKSELWQGEQIQRENETGVRMPDEEYLQNIFGIYKTALGLPEEALGQLRDVFMLKYFMEYETAPGAIGTLERLKSKGISLGIVSNNTPKRCALPLPSWGWPGSLTALSSLRKRAFISSIRRYWSWPVSGWGFPRRTASTQATIPSIYSAPTGQICRRSGCR